MLIPFCGVQRGETEVGVGVLFVGLECSAGVAGSKCTSRVGPVGGRDESILGIWWEYQ